MSKRQPAVFLDRDGVLVEDRGLILDQDDVVIRPGVPGSLANLRDAGYALVVVTNQTVIARGLASEHEVSALNRRVSELIHSAGGPCLDAWYVCPHHPRATLQAYRLSCTCRKPRPGLLVRAAAELAIDLPSSYLVGDRPSDIAAGHEAGCTTILVTSSASADPPIESSGPWQVPVPDCACSCLAEAASWILERS